MKTRYFLSFFLIIALLFASDLSSAQVQFAFRISFSDKKGTSGDISHPGTFLSSRALSRRSTQSIAIDSSDLPVSTLYTDSVLKQCSGILHTRSRWQNNCVVLVGDSSKMNLIRSNPFVKSVTYVAYFLSPLHEKKAKSFDDAEHTPTGSYPSVLKTTGSISYYGDAYDQIKLANGDYLHDKGFRGKGKMIAVLDEGFYLVNTLSGFDSLRSSGRIMDTYNLNLDTSDVYGYSSHGTEVLSTMAGIITGGTYVGTAPDAQYALYITENGSSEQPFEMDNLVAAMERADSVGADIISISLGYNTFSIGSLNADLSLSDIDGKSTIAAMGANTASAKGMLVVSSAGNEGTNAAWLKILTPGDADSALTCGSVDINKIHAASSGYGPNAAGMIKPDVCMLGAPGVVFNSSGTTSAVPGTSIATPELAGLAACLWQAQPAATPYALRKAIRESAHIAASPNNQLGYGVPDFGKATLSLGPVICNCSADILVKPNPLTEDKITVTANTNDTGLLEWGFHNMLGQRILQGSTKINGQAQTFDINLPSNLPPGIYLFHVTLAGNKKTIKLQK